MKHSKDLFEKFSLQIGFQNWSAAAMESVNNNIDVKLFNSSLNGDLEGVVDALAQGGRVAMRNPQGGTPLIAATQNGHTDICGLLLAHGSDVAVSDSHGATPLLVAAQNGHSDICGFLLAHVTM